MQRSRPPERSARSLWLACVASAAVLNVTQLTCGEDPAMVEAHPAAPVKIALDGAAAQVVGGEGFHCARGEAGEVWCWGSNRVGELGLGRRAERQLVPARVGFGAPVTIKALAQGGGVVCGLDDAGALWCWGKAHAPLFGGRREALSPVKVHDGPLKQVSVSGHMVCGVDLKGAPWCIGAGKGQAAAITMQLGAGPAAAVQVGSYGRTLCVEQVEGGARCTSFDPLNAPLPAAPALEAWPALEGLRGIQLGDMAGACGLDEARRVRCVRLELGDPGAAVALPEALRVEASALVATRRVCVIDGAGAARCAEGERDVGEALRGLPAGRIVSLTAGESQCAVMEGGALYCWGNNWHGQVGDGTYTRPPERPAGESAKHCVLFPVLYGSICCGAIMGDKSPRL